MINVSDVVSDPELQAPQPFTVQRSTGQWVLGVFQNTYASFNLLGPVQQATNKEIAMLPEADRVGAVRSFWTTVPLYLTRGYGTTASTHTEIPAGSVPGSVFTLGAAPPGGAVSAFRNGMFLTPNGVDYTLSGTTLTLTSVLGAGDVLLVQWPVNVKALAAISDIILFEGEQYKIMSVYRDPGGGYWKSLGTRLAAA